MSGLVFNEKQKRGQILFGVSYSPIEAKHSSLAALWINYLIYGGQRINPGIFKNRNVHVSYQVKV